jgi:hypothetical protein
MPSITIKSIGNPGERDMRKTQDDRRRAVQEK